MTSVSSDRLRARCQGISAGIFAAPLGRLEDSVHAYAGWGGEILHFDVMDGVFVPQITGGPGFVAALGDRLLRDVHLMVEDPEAQVDTFADAGADIITVHAEAPTAASALARIRAASERLERPILAGLAVMPGTPLESLRALLDPMPDLLLVLALDPRTASSPDVAAASERLRGLAAMVAPARPIMGLDGGVTEATMDEAAASGADIIVSGSAIFRAETPAEACRRLNELRTAARPAQQEVGDAG